MKKSLIALSLIVPMTVGLTGCVVAIGDDSGSHGLVHDAGDREYNNRKKIANLVLHSSYEDAYRQLGVADFTENYEADSKIVKVLYYRTHRLHKDGLTTKDECTYLRFEDGKLVDTGNGGEFQRNR
ncbi:DUF3192 domain-containing protein [Thalassotalea fusca]